LGGLNALGDVDISAHGGLWLLRDLAKDLQ
jgi:hypothetical protein